MGIDDLVNKAKEVVEERGGTDALKEDAKELKDIATGEGSLKEKGQAAVEAIKDPGAKGDDTLKPDGPAAPNP